MIISLNPLANTSVNSYNRPHKLSRNRLSSQFRWLQKSLSSLLLGLVLTWPSVAYAQVEEPDAAGPTEILETLASIDDAASQEDLNQVLEFYDPDFANSDGLTYESLEDALNSFWDRFSNLNYETQLIDWEKDGDTILAQTITTITGNQRIGNRDFNLIAQIESRQRFEDQKIVEQTILSETSQLTAGDQPPTVEVSLPEQVGIGQEFHLDAIVLEPLGDDVLIGAAVEEAVSPTSYVSSSPINLEILSAGGIFKVGQAPAIPEPRWISTVIIREDGMTISSYRLNVTGRRSGL
jgi:ketosteroid isomerase-like protein